VLGLSRAAFICGLYWTVTSITIKHESSTVSLVRLFKKVQTGGGNPMHRSYSKKIQRQIFPPNRLQMRGRVFHEHGLWQKDKKTIFSPKRVQTKWKFSMRRGYGDKNTKKKNVAKRLQTVRGFFHAQGLWKKHSKTYVSAKRVQTWWDFSKRMDSCKKTKKQIIPRTGSMMGSYFPMSRGYGKQVKNKIFPCRDDGKDIQKKNMVNMVHDDGGCVGEFSRVRTTWVPRALE
jgi:hypothetical protein